MALSMSEEEGEIFDGLSVEEIVAFAKEVILGYFAKQQYYCGGSIPEHMLTTPKRINLVLDCTFDMAMDIADEALDLNEEVVRQVIATLHDMAHNGVPQELSNGMLVIYLELCLGVDVLY